MKLSWSSCCGGLAYPGCHEDVILSNTTVFALNANRSVLLLVGNSIMLITTECKWTLREEISEKYIFYQQEWSLETVSTTGIRSSVEQE